MKSPGCEQYLRDPEGNAAHLAECRECLALFGGDPHIDPAPLAITELPLAPWEGASHRAWPLVLISAFLLVGVACGLFVAAGISPLRGFVTTLSGTFPSVEMVKDLVFGVSGALQHIPSLWRLTIALAFVAVNVLLVFLLRRAPKGLDV
jgi:hypothetical protein